MGQQEKTTMAAAEEQGGGTLRRLVLVLLAAAVMTVMMVTLTGGPVYAGQAKGQNDTTYGRDVNDKTGDVKNDKCFFVDSSCGSGNNGGGVFNN